MVIEIELIGWFQDGNIVPIRFRFSNLARELIVIKVDKVISVEDERLAGNHMKVYVCESTNNHTKVLYKLKYEVRTCRWYLHTK